MPRPLLRVRNLTKRYGHGCDLCADGAKATFESNICPKCGAVLACRNVNLELFPQEALGVVGESGSGKSTLVRLLNFDFEPTQGEMHLHTNGTNKGPFTPEPEQNLFTLSSFRKRQLRNFAMGIVYQHPHLGLRMKVSAGGNIAERLLMADWRHVGRIRERAGTLLERTEVPRQRMDEPPANFSGGMQQRVQIAKALSNEPALLLLDEVTTGLDVSVQARVLDLIRKLRKELQVAMLVVSHDLNVIRMLTSRCMVMRMGRVVESGLTDQVLEDPQHPYTQLLVTSAL